MPLFIGFVRTMLLLCFSLSTAVPSPRLGIAQVSPVTFAIFGARRNKRKMLHQSRCRRTKKEEGVQKLWDKPVETMPATISWVETMGNLTRTVWRHGLWAPRVLASAEVLERKQCSWSGCFWEFLKWKSSLALSDKVCLPWLKCVNEQGGGGSLLSATHLLYCATSAKYRLNYFNLNSTCQSKCHTWILLTSGLHLSFSPCTCRKVAKKQIQSGDEW